MVRSAAAFILSESWCCHIWLVGRMKFAALDAKGRGRGILVCPILLFSLHLFEMSPNMIEILLTGPKSRNSINQIPLKQYCICI